MRARWACSAGGLFQGVEPEHGVGSIRAAHLLTGLERATHGRPLRLAKQLAAQRSVQVGAGHASWFTVRQPWHGRADGRGGAAGAAIRSTRRQIQGHGRKEGLEHAELSLKAAPSKNSLIECGSLSKCRAFGRRSTALTHVNGGGLLGAIPSLSVRGMVQTRVLVRWSARQRIQPRAIIDHVPDSGTASVPAAMPPSLKDSALSTIYSLPEASALSCAQPKTIQCLSLCWKPGPVNFSVAPPM